MNDIGTVIAAKWKLVGVQLMLSNGTLQEIQVQCSGKPDECKLAILQVFAEWRNLGTSPYTWKTMINVLKSPTVGEVTLANNLQTKYYS